MTPRERLLKRINRNGDINNFDNPRPLVTLEEFFEGNDDFASIGYNFNPPPGPQALYKLFKHVRDRPDVADVLVEVKDHEDPEGWPSSDTVWIVTSASPDEVQGWLGDQFRADEILEGWGTSLKREPYEVPVGMKAIGVWYD
jgi:hypothetical protein